MTLVMVNRLMHSFQRAIKLIPDIAQNAALKAGLTMGVNITSGAVENAALGARVGRVLGPKGALIGGAVGAVYGGAMGYFATDSAQREAQKNWTEEQKKAYREQQKKRAEYLFEGELTDFKSAGWDSQYDTLREWINQRNKLRQEEVSARAELQNGGSVEVYEKIKEMLEMSESRIRQAGQFLEKSNKDSVETLKTSWMDDLSRMGLYMNTSFANGGGYSEMDILKDQKSILEKIEQNTREDEVAKYSE